MIFFFKQKTAYEMRISDWSSDVCSSDLIAMGVPRFEPSAIGLMGFDAAREEYDIALDEDTRLRFGAVSTGNPHAVIEVADVDDVPVSRYGSALQQRSDEHTCELQ